jgi:hypothetical protein
VHKPSNQARRLRTKATIRMMAMKRIQEGENVATVMDWSWRVPLQYRATAELYMFIVEILRKASHGKTPQNGR